MNKRNRILIFFVLGVGLPSLLLGYLAFRGIRNDQALIEKQNREELLRTINRIQNLVGKEIVSVENSFNAELDYCNKSSLLCQHLIKFIENQPLIEVFFIFDQNKQIHFPEKSTLYLKDGSLSLPEDKAKETAFTEILSSAQRSEFQDKNYKLALSLCKQSFNKSNSQYERAENLNSIARIQKKLKNYKDALQTYTNIKNNFSETRSSNGFPFGIISSLEIAALYSADQQALSAAQILIELYNDLVNKEWLLEQSQYKFFSQKISKSLSGIFKNNISLDKIESLKDSFEKIQNIERKQINLTDRLLLFQNLGKEEIEGGKNLNERFSVSKGKDLFFTAPLIKKIDNDQKDLHYCGFIFNTDYLVNEIFKTTIVQNIKADQITWIITNNNGHQLLSGKNPTTGSITLSERLIKDLPIWQLELYRQDPKLFESFFSFSMGIYFYMFILIGGILIFGFFLTVKTFSHELELAKMKSDFVSTISHEFKSPLTSIRQLSEMLQEGRIPSEERRQKYYDVLVEQSERLTHLTENVLDFAKMEEGKKQFNFESVDIKNLLEDIVSVTQERVKHYGFLLQLNADESIHLIKADKPALTQSINNLIDNAIKYSGSSRKVIIRVCEENGAIIISIQDYGIGIKKEETDKIFDRFYRGGNELTRTVKGSGLGLTLVKQIIVAHKGTIEVKSELGKGSTFIIKLPVDKLKEE